MAWEDPLKLGRNKRTIKDNFKGEVHPFMQNVILADYLSNLALAVIGKGEQINYDATYSCTGSCEEVNFFHVLDKSSHAAEIHFISLLNLCFCEERKKYDTAIRHFNFFKEANINPILGTLIQDRELKFLTLGAFEAKLSEGLSALQIEKQRSYRSRILDYLSPYLAKEVDNLEDYADDIAFSFQESAFKLNPDVFTSDDCSYFRERLFAKALMKVISEHFQWMKLGYFSVMYGGDD